MCSACGVAKMAEDVPRFLGSLLDSGDQTSPRIEVLDETFSSEEEELSDLDIGTKLFTPTSTLQSQHPIGTYFP